MGFWRRVLGPLSTRPETSDVNMAVEDVGPNSSWYAPKDDPLRFATVDGGLPPLHLIEYRDGSGERVLRLCEDSTGLLVSPTDRRLARSSIFVSQLQSENYHKGACRSGDFSPGSSVRLVREPTNKFDANAVAVFAFEGDQVAAYVNKQKARTLARLLDGGEILEAISIRGTGPRQACEQIAVLVAAPKLISHLLSPQPRGLPKPAHKR